MDNESQTNSKFSNVSKFIISLNNWSQSVEEYKWIVTAFEIDFIAQILYIMCSLD